MASSIMASGAASLASKIALKLTVSGRRHILCRWPWWNHAWQNTVNTAGIFHEKPPETKMTMEKQPFEDVYPIGNGDFPLPC